jgi:transcriptional regulator with XRE-family HTH domain
VITDTQQNLIRNMKRMRAELGLSQMDLSERAELSASYIGEIEMGKKFPALPALEKIAAALKTKPFRLLMGEDDVAEWNGGEAYYAAAEALQARLNDELKAFIKARPAPGDPGQADDRPPSGT